MISKFIGRGVRRTDKEVVECAELIAEGFTIFDAEELTGVPHSTISWTIKNRLPRINYDLYEKCMEMYIQHIHEGRIKGGRAGKSTKSNKSDD